MSGVLKLGALIGGVGGLASGARTAVNQVSLQDKLAARREIGPVISRFLDECQRISQAQLTAAVKGVQRSMRDDLAGQIQAERKICEETLAAIAQARKLTPADAAQRAAGIRAELIPINQLISQATAMASRIPHNLPPTSLLATQSADPQTASPPTPLDATTTPFGDWADG